MRTFELLAKTPTNSETGLLSYSHEFMELGKKPSDKRSLPIFQTFDMGRLLFDFSEFGLEGRLTLVSLFLLHVRDAVLKHHCSQRATYRSHEAQKSD